MEFTRHICRIFAVAFAIFAMCVTGCNFLPDVKHQDRYHNPFPQLRTVAVLPFRNQSEQPTLSGERISLAYMHELQAVPGFEVLPVGVVKNQLLAFEQTVLQRSLSTGEDFQSFAKFLGVDAVLQGSIVDYDPYYPPRMTLNVNWYSANPNFHPIPVGYGLPWGTKDEQKIPEWVRLEAERELASEQLSTQTPVSDLSGSYADRPASKASVVGTSVSESAVIHSMYSAAIPHDTDNDDITKTEGKEPPEPELIPAIGTDVTRDFHDTHDHLLLEPIPENTEFSSSLLMGNAATPVVQWPDPQGFIPPAPSANLPPAVKSTGPVITHMYTYNGSDEDFTNELAEYFYFRDDQRFGGWEAYLQRSEDFIRFCCHLHIKQTLVGRGGSLEKRTVVRWPISRYER